MCKNRYTVVDAFYHQLCPECAALNRAKRDARHDLTGRTALLTGGPPKIGMYIALRLLRDGAHTTITTRFPNDAVRPLRRDARRCRLAAPAGRVFGIDLLDPAQVVALPTRWPSRARSTSDQQRGADGAPPARLLRGARRASGPGRPSSST